MNERDIKLHGEVHFLAGFLKGLSDGIGQIRPADMDEEALGRINDAIAQAAKMADQLAIKMSEKDNDTQG